MKRELVKKAVLLFICSAGLWGIHPVKAQPTEGVLRLTLNEALEIAMSENLTVKIADQEITKKEYAKKGAYASLFPQIDFSGSYARTIEKQVMYMDGMEGIEGMDGGIAVGRDNNWSTGFSVSMPLVSASLWKSLKISGYDVDLSVEKARSSRIDMIDQVKQAYYSILLAGDAYDVYKQAYDNAVSNYNETKGKFEQGTLSEYDLIRANVNVKNSEPNMYDSENSLILAKWRLKALMGVDLELNIDCEGTLLDYENDLVGNYLGMDLSLDRNSTLKQFDIQYNQLEKTKEMQIAQYYPSLNMSFSYMWNSMNNNFRFSQYQWDPYSTVGLSLTIPIFSGGKRYNDVRQSQVNLTQLSLQREDTERNLRVAVKQSADQMSTCIKQYQAAKAGVEESEKSYMITEKRYETGEGTILEINDSQLSMTQARLNLNQSIYNYLIAQSSLEKTLGNTTEY